MDKPACQNAFASIMTVVLGLTLSACAFTFVDDDGVRHTIGLMKISEPVEDHPSLAGDVLRVQTVGVSVLLLPSGTAVTVGYSDDTFGSLKNHVLVCGDPRQDIKEIGASLRACDQLPPDTGASVVGQILASEN